VRVNKELPGMGRRNVSGGTTTPAAGVADTLKQFTEQDFGEDEAG